MKKRIGVLLAGGASRRFGAPKAFATLNGRYFYEQVLDVLNSFTSETVIVSHPDLMERFQKETAHPVVEDVPEYQGKGPLAGIYTAMTLYEADDYIIMPCDAPLVRQELIEWLMSQHDRRLESNGVVPVVQERLHPLMGIYSRNCLPFLKKLLEEDLLRVRFLIEQAEVACVDVENDVSLEMFQNINTKEDFNALRPFHE